MLYKLLVVVLVVALPAVLGTPVQHIIGGRDVNNPGTYPYQVSIESSFDESHICGGTLISKDYVLTAAHCVANLHPIDFNVLVGAHDLFEQIQGDPTLIEVAAKVVHPDYDVNAAAEPNDIAVLKLSESADLNSTYIGTVEMAASTSTDADYSDCIMTGWGTHDDILPSDILKMGKVGIYNKTFCNHTIGGAEGAAISDGHICVGKQSDENGDGGITSCGGDNGGPVVCKSGDKSVLVGVMSWTSIFCLPDIPTVCTRVAHYRNWIDEQMKN